MRMHDYYVNLLEPAELAWYKLLLDDAKLGEVITLGMVLGLSIRGYILAVEKGNTVYIDNEVRILAHQINDEMSKRDHQSNLPLSEDLG